MALLLLSACAQVEVKNAEVCGDLGDAGATCFNTLKTDKRDVEKLAWDAERFGELCMSAKAFADFKSEIEKLCSIYPGRCTQEQTQKVKTFFDNVDNFRSAVHR